MPTWTYTGKRVKGSVEAVSIFGARIQKGAAKQQYQGQITRHHLIDIQNLQATWNAVVAREDEETMEALAAWARAATPPRPMNMNATNAPQGLLKKIAWNPFNIVVGPITNYRIGDPGDDFDNLVFRDLPKFAATNGNDYKENLARQEFNTHLYRLRQIYLLMERYVSGDAPQQIVASLRSSLRQDVPGKYAHLDRAVGTSGSLLHPALWQDYSLIPNRWFIKAGDDKKFENAQTNHMVPYVSKSYFVEFPVQPKDQFGSVREDIKSAPTSSPAATIPTSDRRLFSAVMCGACLEEKLKPLARFASGSGVRVIVCAAKDHGLFRDLCSNVGGAVQQIAGKNGWKLTWCPLARPEFSTTEVRIYLK